MAEKVGTLIREARTKAGFTQEQLARKIKGISADDISKAERGEKELTQAVLKEIAKATGVTQKSLIDAAKGTAPAKKTAQKTASSKTSAAKKAGTSKTGTSKTGTSKTGTSKAGTSKAGTSKAGTSKAGTSKTGTSKTGTSKTASSKTASGKTAAKKTSSKTAGTGSSRTELRLSAEEKKLIKAYREADDRIKAGVKLMLLGTDSMATEAGAGDMLGALLGSVKELFGRREI